MPIAPINEWTLAIFLTTVFVAITHLMTSNNSANAL